MSFERFIASRYLSSKNKPFFIKFLLWISFLAIATGVFAVVFISSIMSGFQDDFERRVMGFKAPLTLIGNTASVLQTMPMEDIKKIDTRIQKVVPFVDGEALIQVSHLGEATSVGVRVRGIGEAPERSRVGDFFESETFEKSLLMGDQLAATLDVRAEDAVEGLEIRLIFPLGDIGPSGDLIPRVRKLRLNGFFHSGYFDYDNKYVLVSYIEGKRLFAGEAMEGFEIWTASLENVDALKDKIQKRFPDLQVLSWKDQNPKLFSALKLEKLGMFLLLTILLLIASFNIFGVVTLTVLEKRKDIAVLRTIGMTKRRLKKVFLLKALILGLRGAAAGMIAALTLLGLMVLFPLKLPETYYVEFLPIQVRWGEVVFAFLMGPFVTLVAAYYPARQAAQPAPMEILRYE